MNRVWAVMALALMVLADGAPSMAATMPRPGAVDPRMRTVWYDPDQVVSLKGFFGYQMMIEFGDDERIENVSIGDAVAWQVTPNRKANLLFIKPIERDIATNMTVVTDRRRYAFELSAHAASGPRAPEMAYVVRFLYPPDPSPARAEPPPPPERRNTAYTYTGSRASLPSLVFDDGHFTYFQWPAVAATPALFTLGPDGSESTVNYVVRDGYVVVEQVAARFLLRNGKDVTTVINDAWRDPVPPATAPRPHDQKTAREAVNAERGR
jgi:type IV secretion system protein VirB9